MAKRSSAARGRKGSASRKRSAARPRPAKRANAKRQGGKSFRATGKGTGAGKKSSRKGTARRAAPRSAARRRQPSRPSRLAGAATRVRAAAAGAVAAVAERLPWAADENDPIALLEADHRRFEDLLKQGEDTTVRAVVRRTELLDTLSAELTLHELLEEKILYPALKAHSEARDIVLEGYQEHHVADLIVRELHQLARDDEKWGAKFKVLKETLEHHIEEEEGEMFRTARSVLSREELRELGAQMRALRAEHMGETRG